MRNFNCTATEVTEANFKTSACLFTFNYSQKYFLSTVDDHMFSVFISKAQNEYQILTFIHLKLTWK